MLKPKKKEINNVCSKCGIEANRLTCLKKYGKEPKQKAFLVSTFHKGKCDFCGKETSVTEIRDFFHPDFNLLKKSKWLGKSQKNLKSNGRILKTNMKKEIDIIQIVIFAEEILSYFNNVKKGVCSGLVWYELISMSRHYLKKPYKGFEEYLGFTLNIQKKDLTKIKKNYFKKLKEIRNFI